MKNTVFRFTKLGYALAVGMMMSQGQLALAGWSGAQNGYALGVARANVTSAAEKVSNASTPLMTGPNVSIQQFDYQYGAPLPIGASLNTVAQVRAFPGYIWQAYTVANNGDDAGNPELEAHLPVAASERLAYLIMTASLADFDEQTKSGTIEINAEGTAGAVFWGRGYEILDGQVPPPDDPETPDVDEFKEFVKEHGVLRWDVAAAGPYVSGGCSTVTIPFTIATSLDCLYFLSDGMAKSLPLIDSPEDITVSCGESVVYPTLTDLEAREGVISLTYDPPLPPGGIFPLGSTPVTVTATDVDGNTAICAFNVIVTGASFHGFYPPIGDLGGACDAPVRTAKLGNSLPVKFDISCGGQPVITGAPTLSIEKPSVANDCSSTLVPVLNGLFQLVQNEWHFNWDTGSGGVVAGPYKLTATLQDGAQYSVWVYLK